MTSFQKILHLFLLTTLSAFWTTYAIVRLVIVVFKNGFGILSNQKRRDQKPEALLDPTFSHDFIQLSELKIHYASTGDQNKPLMLFLHGFPEFWYSWRHQLKEFSTNYWCVAIDMRGYGESEKPKEIGKYTLDRLALDVKEIVDALGRKNCTLVAHDWGGAVAWYAASRYPEIIDKLIVMNIPHGNVFYNHLTTCWKQFVKSWYMFFFQCPYIPEFIYKVDDYKGIESCFLEQPMGLTNRQRFTEDDIEAWKYTYSKPDAITAPINYYRAAMRRLAKPLPKEKVKPPVLIIWGTCDAALNTEMAAMSAEYCNSCEVKYVEGASHWVQQDEPERVNALMHQFLGDKSASD